jgi:transposase
LSTPWRQGGDRKSVAIEAHANEIVALVAARADITLAEIAAHIEQRHGRRFAPSVIWRCFDRRGLTFKKIAHASEQTRAIAGALPPLPPSDCRGYFTEACFSST